MDPRQELRGYLNLLSEEGFAVPTEQEYYQYVQNFQAGNSAIDYAIRNLFVLDDEETRITDEYERAKGQNRLDEWANSWKPQLGDQEIGIIQNALETAGASHQWVDTVRKVLEPHISNADLYQAHDAYWEEIFFATGENKPYEEFVVDVEEMGL